MEWKYSNVLRTGQTMQGFLDEQATHLGRVNQSAARRLLDRCVRELAAAAAMQVSATDMATGQTKEKKRIRRDLLEQHFQQVVAISKREMLLKSHVHLVRMPPQRASDGELIARSHKIAATARALASEVRGQQLSENLSAEVLAKAKELQRALIVHDMHIARRSGVTKSIVELCSSLRETRAVLNGLVVKELRLGNPLLAGWEKAKRFAKKPGPKRGG